MRRRQTKGRKLLGQPSQKNRSLLKTAVIITLPAVIISSSITYLLTKRSASKRITFSIALKPEHRPIASKKSAAVSARAKTLSASLAKARRMGQGQENEDHPIATDESRDLPRYLASGPMIVGKDGLKPLNQPNTVCQTVEVGGMSATYVKVKLADWKFVIEQFHESKKRLLKWLADNHKQLPDPLTHQMEARIRDIKIVKPPTFEEQDLNWRGMGIFGRDDSRGLVVRIGPGMVRLIVSNPQRGLFELTRLIVQSWAPCELKALGFPGVWDTLLKCLEVSESDACGKQSYSEGGWAMSTTLAVAVAPPGCKIPALAEEAQAKCAQQIPLPLTMQNQELSESIWRQQ